MQEEQKYKFKFHYFDTTIGCKTATWDRPMVLVSCNEKKGFPEFQIPRYFKGYQLKSFSWLDIYHSFSWSGCSNDTRPATYEEIQSLLFNNEEWRGHPDRIKFLEAVRPQFEEQFKEQIQKDCFLSTIKKEIGI